MSDYITSGLVSEWTTEWCMIRLVELTCGLFTKALDFYIMQHV